MHVCSAGKQQRISDFPLLPFLAPSVYQSWVHCRAARGNWERRGFCSAVAKSRHKGHPRDGSVRVHPRCILSPVGADVYSASSQAAKTVKERKLHQQQWRLVSGVGPVRRQSNLNLASNAPQHYNAGAVELAKKLRSPIEDPEEETMLRRKDPREWYYYKRQNILRELVATGRTSEIPEAYLRTVTSDTRRLFELRYEEWQAFWGLDRVPSKRFYPARDEVLPGRRAGRSRHPLQSSLAREVSFSSTQSRRLFSTNCTVRAAFFDLSNERTQSSSADSVSPGQRHILTAQEKADIEENFEPDLLEKAPTQMISQTSIAEYDSSQIDGIKKSGNETLWSRSYCAFAAKRGIQTYDQRSNNSSGDASALQTISTKPPDGETFEDLLYHQQALAEVWDIFDLCGSDLASWQTPQVRGKWLHLSLHRQKRLWSAVMLETLNSSPQAAADFLEFSSVPGYYWPPVASADVFDCLLQMHRLGPALKIDQLSRIFLTCSPEWIKRRRLHPETLMIMVEDCEEQDLMPVWRQIKSAFKHLPADLAIRLASRLAKTELYGFSVGLLRDLRLSAPTLNETDVHAIISGIISSMTLREVPGSTVETFVARLLARGLVLSSELIEQLHKSFSRFMSGNELKNKLNFLAQPGRTFSQAKVLRFWLDTTRRSRQESLIIAELHLTRASRLLGQDSDLTISYLDSQRALAYLQKTSDSWKDFRRDYKRYFELGLPGRLGIVRYESPNEATHKRKLDPNIVTDVMAVTTYLYSANRQYKEEPVAVYKKMLQLIKDCDKEVLEAASLPAIWHGFFRFFRETEQYALAAQVIRDMTGPRPIHNAAIKSAEMTERTWWLIADAMRMAGRGDYCEGLLEVLHDTADGYEKNKRLWDFMTRDLTANASASRIASMLLRKKELGVDYSALDQQLLAKLEPEKRKQVLQRLRAVDAGAGPKNFFDGHNFFPEHRLSSYDPKENMLRTLEREQRLWHRCETPIREQVSNVRGLVGRVKSTMEKQLNSRDPLLVARRRLENASAESAWRSDVSQPSRTREEKKEQVIARVGINRRPESPRINFAPKTMGDRYQARNGIRPRDSNEEYWVPAL